jgi:hypothetical protein
MPLGPEDLISPIPEGESLESYFIGNVRRLIDDNLEYVSSGSIQTMSYEMVHFLDERANVHAAYERFDTVDQAVDYGIHIARPELKGTRFKDKVFDKIGLERNYVQLVGGRMICRDSFVNPGYTRTLERFERTFGVTYVIYDRLDPSYDTENIDDAQRLVNDIEKIKSLEAFLPMTNLLAGKLAVSGFTVY